MPCQLKSATRPIKHEETPAAKNIAGITDVIFLPIYE